MGRSHKTFRHYLVRNAGAVAIWFGMALPLVVSGVGMSVDLGQSFLAQERLSHALDAAALAAAASPSDDPQVIEDKVNDFIDANYPPGKVGFTTDINIVNHDDVLYVSGKARVDSNFLKVVGNDYLEVFSETEVTKEVKSIEVVLVMDVTGSMATKTNGKTRIQGLKDASHLFIDTMFRRVNDRDQIKIGLVPFSASVNVGRYGLGKTPSGQNYGSAFVSNPRNISYFDPFSKSNPSTTEKKRWWGCIQEDDYPDDTLDHDGPWDMYRYCRNSSEQVKCDSNNATNNANIGCPKRSVTPMTNNRTELDDAIDDLTAEGNTYINVGLVWGLRMLSPEAPFREGVAWNNEDWKKAIILMTDGVNEPHPYYSAYGLDNSYDRYQEDITGTKLNNRMLDVCDELKAKNVLVYTITFDKGVNTATKNLFKSCATQPGMWYDAPDSEKLEEVYMTIAKELANLHLSK